MHKHSYPIVQPTSGCAAFGLRALLTELQLLTGSLPDLRHAFDADELPITFILKRDAHLTRPDERHPVRFSRQAKSSPTRRTTSSRTANRRRPRKLMSDE